MADDPNARDDARQRLLRALNGEVDEAPAPPPRRAPAPVPPVQAHSNGAGIEAELRQIRSALAELQHAAGEVSATDEVEKFTQGLIVLGRHVDARLDDMEKQIDAMRVEISDLPRRIAEAFRPDPA